MSIDSRLKTIHRHNDDDMAKAMQQLQVFDDAIYELATLVEIHCHDKAALLRRIWAAHGEINNKVNKNLASAVNDLQFQLLNSKEANQKQGRGLSSLSFDEVADCDAPSISQSTYSLDNTAKTKSSGLRGELDRMIQLNRRLELDLIARDKEMLKSHEALTRLSVWFPSFQKFAPSVLTKFLPPVPTREQNGSFSISASIDDAISQLIVKFARSTSITSAIVDKINELDLGALASSGVSGDTHVHKQRSVEDILNERQKRRIQHQPSADDDDELDEAIAAQSFLLADLKRLEKIGIGFTVEIPAAIAPGPVERHAHHDAVVVRPRHAPRPSFLPVRQTSLSAATGDEYMLCYGQEVAPESSGGTDSIDCGMDQQANQPEVRLEAVENAEIGRKMLIELQRLDAEVATLRRVLLEEKSAGEQEISALKRQIQQLKATLQASNGDYQLLLDCLPNTVFGATMHDGSAWTVMQLERENKLLLRKLSALGNQGLPPGCDNEGTDVESSVGTSKTLAVGRSVTFSQSVAPHSRNAPQSPKGRVFQHPQRQVRNRGEKSTDVFGKPEVVDAQKSKEFDENYILAGIVRFARNFMHVSSSATIKLCIVENIVQASRGSCSRSTGSSGNSVDVTSAVGVDDAVCANFGSRDKLSAQASVRSFDLGCRLLRHSEMNLNASDDALPEEDHRSINCVLAHFFHQFLSNSHCRPCHAISSSAVMRRSQGALLRFESFVRGCIHVGKHGDTSFSRFVQLFLLDRDTSLTVSSTRSSTRPFLNMSGRSHRETIRSMISDYFCFSGARTVPESNFAADPALVVLRQHVLFDLLVRGLTAMQGYLTTPTDSKFPVTATTKVLGMLFSTVSSLHGSSLVETPSANSQHHSSVLWELCATSESEIIAAATQKQRPSAAAVAIVTLSQQRYDWWQFLSKSAFEKLVHSVELSSISEERTKSDVASLNRPESLYSCSVDAFECLQLCWHAVVDQQSKIVRLLKRLFSCLLAIVPDGTCNRTFQLLLSYVLQQSHIDKRVRVAFSFDNKLFDQDAEAERTLDSTTVSNRTTSTSRSKSPRMLPSRGTDQSTTSFKSGVSAADSTDGSSQKKISAKDRLEQLRAMAFAEAVEVVKDNCLMNRNSEIVGCFRFPSTPTVHVELANELMLAEIQAPVLLNTLLGKHLVHLTPSTSSDKNPSAVHEDDSALEELQSDPALLNEVLASSFASTLIRSRSHSILSSLGHLLDRENVATSPDSTQSNSKVELGYAQVEAIEGHFIMTELQVMFLHYLDQKLQLPATDDDGDAALLSCGTLCFGSMLLTNQQNIKQATEIFGDMRSYKNSGFKDGLAIRKFLFGPGHNDSAAVRDAYGESGECCLVERVLLLARLCFDPELVRVQPPEPLECTLSLMFLKYMWGVLQNLIASSRVTKQLLNRSLDNASCDFIADAVLFSSDWSQFGRVESFYRRKLQRKYFDQWNKTPMAKNDKC